MSHLLITVDAPFGRWSEKYDLSFTPAEVLTSKRVAEFVCRRASKMLGRKEVRRVSDLQFHVDVFASQTNKTIFIDEGPSPAEIASDAQLPTR